MSRFMSRDLMTSLAGGGSWEDASVASCNEPSCTPSNPEKPSTDDASAADLEGLRAHLRAALG